MRRRGGLEKKKKNRIDFVIIIHGGVSEILRESFERIYLNLSWLRRRSAVDNNAGEDSGRIYYYTL